MSEKNFCPCCGRHCDLDAPHCECGKEYAETGAVIQKKYDPSAVEKGRRDVDYHTLDVDKKLILNLRDLGHMIRFLFEGKGSQKRILIILQESGGMTQRELTERLGIQPGSASEVIGKLEHAGLLLRTPGSADRRTADLQLTEAGSIQAQAAAEQRRLRHQEMFSCLSEEEKEMLVVLAEKLNADWNRRYHGIASEHGHSRGTGRDRGMGGKRKHGEYRGSYDELHRR